MKWRSSNWSDRSKTRLISNQSNGRGPRRTRTIIHWSSSSSLLSNWNTDLASTDLTISKSAWIIRWATQLLLPAKIVVSCCNQSCYGEDLLGTVPNWNVRLAIKPKITWRASQRQPRLLSWISSCTQAILSNKSNRSSSNSSFKPWQSLAWQGPPAGTAQNR